MKFLIVVLFVATFAAVQAGSSGYSEEQKIKYREHINECKASTKITAAELTKLRSAEGADDPKCYSNCILEKYGLIKDGVVQEAAILEVFSSYLTEDKAKQIDDLCRGETGANKCETAYKLSKCFRAIQAFSQ